MGAGIGLSLSALFDLVLIGVCYGRHYGFRLSSSTTLLALQQTILLALTLVVCLYAPPVWRWLMGGLLFVLSLVRSYVVLAAETTIIDKIRHRL